jgi:hypothetical protein
MKPTIQIRFCVLKAGLDHWHRPRMLRSGQRRPDAALRAARR